MNTSQVLITGGADGLGAVIARLAAARGRPLLIVDRDRSAGLALVAELQDSGAEARFCEVELTESAEVRELFASLDAARLGLLVNNAGGWLPGPQFPDGDQWERSLDLNLRTPMLATQLALPHLRGGAVVNISSSGGWDSSAYGSPEYGAAKAGLIRFTTSVSDFVDRFGVRVSCVVPHWIGLPRAVADYAALTSDEQRRSGGLVDPQVVADAVWQLAEDPTSAGRVVLIRAGRPPYAIDPAPDPWARTG